MFAPAHPLTRPYLVLVGPLLANDSTADRFEAVLGRARRLPGADTPTGKTSSAPAVLTPELMAAAQRYVSEIEGAGPADADSVDRFELDLTGDGAYLTVIYTDFDKNGCYVGSAGRRVFISPEGHLAGERSLDVSELRRILIAGAPGPLSG